MITVGKLKEYLERFDDDTRVVIGMCQIYGSNWANEIELEEDVRMVDFFYSPEEPCVVLTQTDQIGTVDYSDEE